ncbi:MAG: DUF2442 domain-containing protein [Simkaniaceae bacterium]|nr:DUF2442 domain-containing protein [Simkaniaceae bacterium]
MLHTIKKVEYLDRYRLKLHFDDKTIKTVDLEDMLKNAKNMFIPLLDVSFFEQVECDGTTICWPNGVDLCPDVLYDMGEDFKKSKANQLKQIPKSRKKSQVNAK